VVPPLTGQTYEDAARALAELGLEPQREDVVSDAVPPGRVIGTDPTAGTRVSPRDTIIVFVARSPEPTATPTATATATSSPTPTAT
jgi:beta-lactam-binding protein with PASTA domain